MNIAAASERDEQYMHYPIPLRIVARTPSVATAVRHGATQRHTKRAGRRRAPSFHAAGTARAIEKVHERIDDIAGQQGASRRGRRFVDGLQAGPKMTLSLLRGRASASTAIGAR